MVLAAEKKTKPLFRYRFGSAVFDEARFELSVAGLKVDTERKPLEVLALLLAHAGEVVTKDELLTEVWAGRPTVETVITNAITKLRAVLGDSNASHIVTQPRVGYRLAGSVERVAVGRAMTSHIELIKDGLVPLRPHFQLESLLNSSRGSEVWLARHLKTGELRVYKFAPDGERLSVLKREVTLFRLLQETLGARADLARILDWNFESAPFFIECEYGGESLQAWAQRPTTLKSLSLHRRVELFLQIADVVAAAHDVGVLHKDIKPANVLIAPKSDTAWHIRLTDFGSGRLLDNQRIEELGITQLGLTMTTAAGKGDTSGTLLYLAPELMTHQAPTIQSDVFALGMMLFQLLVGDLRKPLAPGWEREIGDELLRDDIRAATEGDPVHRLSSARDLIQRLRTLDARHQNLQHERQIQHVAGIARESARRARARRPWMMAAIAILTIGLVTSSWLCMRAIRVQHQLLQSQAITKQQASRADVVTKFLKDDVLGAADPFSEESVKHRTVQQAMAAAANRIDGKFSNEPMTEAAIRTALGDIFDSTMEHDAAEAQWRRAVVLLADAGAAARPQLLRSRYALARTLSQQAKFAQAAAELASADLLQSQLGAVDPPTLIMAHSSWAIYFSGQMQNAQAIPHFEQVLQLLLGQSSPDFSEINRARVALAGSYLTANRLQEAEQLSRAALDDLKLHDSSTLSLADAYELYGESLLYQHHYQAAEPALDESYRLTVSAVGMKNRHTLNILNVRCVLYGMTLQLDKQLQCTSEAYDASRAIMGDQHTVTFIALLNLGEAQYALDRYAAASRSLESARAGLASVVSVDNFAIQAAHYYLARSLLQLNQAGRAKALAQGLDAKMLDGGEPGAPWALRLQLLHGLILLGQGQRNAALPLLQVAAQLHDDADPTDTILKEARRSLLKSGLANMPRPTSREQAR